jgi:histone H3/H4
MISKSTIQKLGKIVDIKRIGNDFYDEIRNTINTHVNFLMNISLKFAEHGHSKTRRKTMQVQDVKNALEKYANKANITITPTSIPEAEYDVFHEKTFYELCKKYLEKESTKITRISRESVILVKNMVEKYLIVVCKSAKLNADHREKTTILASDLILAKKVRGDEMI